MPYVRWKLKEFAQAHGLNGYTIAKQMIRSSDAGRPATAYRLLGDDPPARVDLGTLATLITALRELVPGEAIDLPDLLEYVAEGEAPEPATPRRTGKKAAEVPPALDDEPAAF